MALYCALSARDFRSGVVLAVNHGGDSDSTGSMAGQLLGATHGAQAIPGSWLEPLELRDVCYGAQNSCTCPWPPSKGKRLRWLSCSIVPIGWPASTTTLAEAIERTGPEWLALVPRVERALRDEN